MDWSTLIKLLMLQIANQRNDQAAPKAPAKYDSPDMMPISSILSPVHTVDNVNGPKDPLKISITEIKDTANETSSDDSADIDINYLMPFDCLMPIPPHHDSEVPPVEEIELVGLGDEKENLDVIPPTTDEANGNREENKLFDGESVATAFHSESSPPVEVQSDALKVDQPASPEEAHQGAPKESQQAAPMDVQPSESTALAVLDVQPEKTGIDETRSTETAPAKASIRIDLNNVPPQPDSENIEKTQQEKIATNEPTDSHSVDVPHAMASIRIPIHIVHKLPDSEIIELHRFEGYCEDKIKEVYKFIKTSNDFDIQKIKETQYLQYSEQRKEDIRKQSNEKKDAIKEAYVRMHRVCNRAESKRNQITSILNPYLGWNSQFYAQPRNVPQVWYDMHNLEVIILQLFTPKLTVKTFYDANEKVLRMRPRSTLDLTRKQFIPLPIEFTSPSVTIQTSDDGTIDGSKLIMEENHPKTAVDLATKDKPDEKSNNNPFEPLTYSTDKDIQQIIVYYLFKYWEHEVRDLTQKVFYNSKTLRMKKRSNANAEQINEWEDRLAEATAELQAAAKEMERNYVDPLISELYKAENAAHDLLPGTEFSTKLIGNENKRVVFDPTSAIKLNQLAGDSTQRDIAKNDLGPVAEKKFQERLDLPDSPDWDRNWEWDY